MSELQEIGYKHFKEGKPIDGFLTLPDKVTKNRNNQAEYEIGWRAAKLGIDTLQKIADAVGLPPANDTQKLASLAIDAWALAQASHTRRAYIQAGETYLDLGKLYTNEKNHEKAADAFHRSAVLFQGAMKAKKA